MVQAELVLLEELRERKGYRAQGAGPFTPNLQLQALSVWLPDEKRGTLLPDRGRRLGDSLLETEGLG